MNNKWLLIGILSFIWGSSFILMKRGLIAFSGTQLASMRIGISCLVFLPVIIFHRKSLSTKNLKPIIAMGILGNGIPPFMFAIAQQHINSSLAGVLNSMTVIFTLVVGILFFKERGTKNKIIGVILGFVGTTILTLSKEAGGLLQAFNWFASLVLVATICYGFSVNIIKRYLNDEDPLLLAAMTFMIIGPPCIVYLFSTDFIKIITYHPEGLTSFLYIVILAIMGTTFTKVLFNHLVQQTNSVFASGVTYLIPIVALCWGIWDGESLYWTSFIGIGLILGGILLTRINN